MRLVMTLLVRDEADIIKANIEYHLANGVDAIVAVDNGSIDGTRDILDDYSRVGDVVVFDEPGRDYSQSKWVTFAALHARNALGADWIINNDADEFWTVPDATLKEVINQTTADALTCPRVHMFDAYDAPADSDWAQRMVYRVAQPVPRVKLPDIYNSPLPCPYFYLDLPTKMMVKAEGLKTVSQGNHSAKFDAPVEPTLAPIEIFHFPVRSQEQFEKKIVQGGMAYQAATHLPERVGWHWRRWYRKYLDHGIEAAISDALPSHAQLENELAQGVVLKDLRFKEIASKLNL